MSATIETKTVELARYRWKPEPRSQYDYSSSAGDKPADDPAHVVRELATIVGTLEAAERTIRLSVKGSTLFVFTEIPLPPKVVEVAIDVKSNPGAAAAIKDELASNKGPAANPAKRKRARR